MPRSIRRSRRSSRPWPRPGRFDGFHAGQVSLEALERILEAVPEGVSELMCHPGRVDAQLEAGSTYVAEREWEIEVLCDPGIRRRVRARGIELVGFGAV